MCWLLNLKKGGKQGCKDAGKFKPLRGRKLDLYVDEVPNLDL